MVLSILLKNREYNSLSNALAKLDHIIIGLHMFRLNVKH